AWQGRFNEAVPHYTGALSGGRRTRGDDHFCTLLVMSNLSGALRECGRLEEAEAQAAEAVRRGREHPPGEAWWLGLFLNNHSKALPALERFREAEAAGLEADSLLTPALGEGHVRVVAIAEHLASLYGAWDRSTPGAGHDER